MLIICTNRGEMKIRFAKKEVIVAQAPYQHNQFKEYYVGGAPQEIRERYVFIKSS